MTTRTNTPAENDVLPVDRRIAERRCPPTGLAAMLDAYQNDERPLPSYAELRALVATPPAKVQGAAIAENPLLIALRKIVNTVPAISPDGQFFTEHRNGDGEYIGAEFHDPATIIQSMAGVALFAIEAHEAALAVPPIPAPQSLKDTFAEALDALHYPGCWDVAAYPALPDALSAVYEHFKCSQCAESSERRISPQSGAADSAGGGA